MMMFLRVCHWGSGNMTSSLCWRPLSARRILGDPGAVSRVDKMLVVKVFCKIETSPWALTLTEQVPEAFELPASDWPEKFLLDLHPFSDGNGRLCRILCSYSLSKLNPFPTPIYSVWNDSPNDAYIEALVEGRNSPGRMLNIVLTNNLSIRHFNVAE